MALYLFSRKGDQARRTGGPDMALSRSSLLSLRRRFAGLPDRAHKQMGLRAIRNALQMLESNPTYAAEQAARAEFHLPHAEAAR